MSDDKHEKALDLTEEALEKIDSGDEAAADRLIKEAKALDPEAPREILADLEDTAKLRDEN